LTIEELGLFVVALLYYVKSTVLLVLLARIEPKHEHLHVVPLSIKEQIFDAGETFADEWLHIRSQEDILCA
jgi:hypothetical protein